MSPHPLDQPLQVVPGLGELPAPPLDALDRADDTRGLVPAPSRCDLGEFLFQFGADLARALSHR